MTEINNIYFTHFCTTQSSIWQNWDQNYKVVATVIQGVVGDDRHSNKIWNSDFDWCSILEEKWIELRYESAGTHLEKQCHGCHQNWI